ncbi:FAD-binding oxidoreductase [Undibacterium arcticum]
MTTFLDLCRSAIGADYVVTDDADMASYLIDWRRRFSGNALAVVKPANTEEVAAIVRLCNQFRVPVVPQGGNTGLVLGSVPDDSGTAIVMSLVRLNRIRAIDTVNNTMTAEAGCILEKYPERSSRSGATVPAVTGSGGQLHYRRQSCHQCRRYRRTALRQRTRTMPGT